MPGGILDGGILSQWGRLVRANDALAAVTIDQLGTGLVLDLQDGGSSVVTVGQSGITLITTSTVQLEVGVAEGGLADLLIYRDENSAGGILQTRYDSATSAAWVGAGHAGGTIAAPTATQNGQNLGEFAGFGYDGTNWRGGGQLGWTAVGAFSATNRGADFFLESRLANDPADVTAWRRWLTVSNSGVVTIDQTVHPGVANSQPLVVQANDNVGFVIRGSTATAAESGFVTIQHSRGTIAAPTATQSGDRLGTLMFGGYGTSWVGGASVAGYATEIWSVTARGSQVNIYTVPNTTLTGVLRWTFDQDGALLPAANLVLAVTGTRLSQSYHTNITSTNAVTVDSWGASKENWVPYDSDAMAVIRQMELGSYRHLLDRDPSGRIKLGAKAESILEPRVLVETDYGHGLGIGPALDTMGYTTIAMRALQQADERLSLVEQQVKDIADRTWPLSMSDEDLFRRIEGMIASSPEHKVRLRQLLEVVDSAPDGEAGGIP